VTVAAATDKGERMGHHHGAGNSARDEFTVDAQGTALADVVGAAVLFAWVLGDT
jgi:hypothetical protein